MSDTNDENVQALLGSSIQPNEIDINGVMVSLGEVVGAAFTRSGLSIESWNALPEDEMEMNIELEIEIMRTPDTAVTMDAANANGTDNDSDDLHIETAEEAQVRLAAEAAFNQASLDNGLEPISDVLPDAEEEEVLPTLTPAVQRVKNGLDVYAEAMASNAPQNPESGGQQQRAFYYTLLSILALNGKDFGDAMSLMLSYFADRSKSAFQQRLVFRFIEHTPMSNADRDALKSLLILFIETADPQARALAMKSVDIGKVVKHLPDVEMQARLLGFYSQS